MKWMKFPEEKKFSEDTYNILLGTFAYSTFEYFIELLSEIGLTNRTEIEYGQKRFTNEIYQSILEEKVDLLVTSLYHVDGPKDGIKLINDIRKIKPDLPIIVWSKHYNHFEEVRNKYGVQCIEKHIDDENLKKAILKYTKNSNYKISKNK